jgi:predicted phosphodiesterase
MRTLVISDLHLGSITRRDVLRGPVALEALVAGLEGVDRLVLLGDTVELLEGAPGRAMRAARPVLEEIGHAMGREREIVLVPGNHDHALIRPWLRARRADGKRIGLASAVAVRSSPGIAAIAGWLRPARVRVRYPGMWLAPRIWAHHGHYLDRHLVRRQAIPGPRATAEHYERALGAGVAAFGALMATALPEPLGEPADRLAGLVRRAGVAAVPVAEALPGFPSLAPFSAGVLGLQFRRAGLPAMASVAQRLGVRADHVVFGHVHRAGPRPADRPGEWAPLGTPKLWNAGCWVYEPLLLAGSQAPHPYWPGGGILVEDGGPPQPVAFLDDVDRRALQ